MFNSSTAQRVLLRNKTPLVQQPVRRFMNYGPTYKSGHERMIEDKLQWFGAQSLAGMGFVIWGVLNLGTYGLSKVMHKENFDYHFAYKGQGKFMQPLRSMMAADSLTNVGWTAPSLIGGGFYLQSRIGSLTTFKIFGLSLIAAYLATCSLGPATKFGSWHLRGMVPDSMRCDSIDNVKGRMVGADLMAGICLYSCLFAGGWWMPGVAFAGLDALYYGPMGIAMPATAAIATLTLL